MSSNNMPMVDADAGNPSEELLVWPWTGVMARITAGDDGDATTTSTLASHAQQHFPGIPTTMLQEEEASAAGNDGGSHRCHFLLLHFGKSWSGIRGAMSLAFHFARAGGRTEWQRQRQHGDASSSAGAGAGRVFGWAAGEEDLLGGGAVGRYLRESGATARSVEDVQEEEARHAGALAAVRDDYEKREKFLGARSEELLRLLRKTEQENSCLLAELKELQAMSSDKLPELSLDDEENEKLRAELDKIREEIEFTVDRIQELKEGRTGLHCSKVEKLVIEINSVEKEDREAKAMDHVQMLHEKHKEEMEAINAEVDQLEKQLEQKDAVSAMSLLEILKTGENLRKEELQHLYKLMTIWKECQEQERERYQNAHVDLTKRDRLNRDELQETRQELIKCLESVMIGGFTDIGIKRMGQLDEEPFYHACKRKYRDDDPEGKAARLASIWQEELKNTLWNPFTTILVDGEEQDVVDEDDPKLRQLWTEYGDYTCNAVKNALRELNEYSPEGRQAVDELWNFREGRKATVAEVLKYIFEQLKMRN